MNISDYQLNFLILIRLPRYSLPPLHVNGYSIYPHNEEMR